MRVVPDLSESNWSSDTSLGLWSSSDFAEESEWRARFEDLGQIGELQPNWDGEGADVPGRMVLLSVEALLRRMYAQQETPPSRIVATPDGTVVIEWQYLGAYRECEIADSGKAEWLLQMASGDVVTWEDRLLLPSEIGADDWQRVDESNEYHTPLLSGQYLIAA